MKSKPSTPASTDSALRAYLSQNAMHSMDGVSLRSAAYPVVPWYRRILFCIVDAARRLFRGGSLRPDSLETIEIYIKEPDVPLWNGILDRQLRQDAYKRKWANIYARRPNVFNIAGTNMNDEQEIEAKLQANNLNAPRLSPADIDAVIAGRTFTILPSGRTTICELTLKNGFTLRGESSVVFIENFNREIGEELAYKDARRKVWQLEAYRLRLWHQWHALGCP